MSTDTPNLYLATDNGEVPRERTETTYATQEQAWAWPVELRASLIRAGHLGQPPVRWATIVSLHGPRWVDLWTPQWRMHHVLIDEDAVTNFVYRKRPSEWLGLLDVGRELMWMCTDESRRFYGPDYLRERFESRYLNSKTTEEEVLEKLLGLSVSTAIEAFWKRVADNQQKRKIRLIFADQEIPANVREPIALLNQQLTDIEMLAVEVRSQPT